MMFRICSSLHRSAVTAAKESKRFYSDAGKLVTVTTDDKSGISTVSLNRPPVNGLNYDLLQSISTALTTLEKSKCRGMILTSDNPSVFSAGLDILEMYKPDPARVKDFWTTLQDTWIKLYTTSFPTVALINGHSPAGGCLLALSSLPRKMTKLEFREATVNWLLNNKEKDLQIFLNYINQPKVQEGLGMYLESLKKKSAK
ncbi:hypothetical protein LSTR_LSTR010909 [Laodelphax striatellus]|uniref:Uncharacterized protein n=1 Tax=Laodelphax striatellus TaxID=195883 RepID=A0A482WZ89_LAOST|nr:hypothetical protein LSTR_LSTR010909 [Laodelphax striatellus]